MTLQARILSTGLLVAALPAWGLAQVVNERIQAQPGQPAQPVAANANVAADEQQTQHVITHALGSALFGGQLQLTAQPAHSDRYFNQNAGDNNQNRRDRDNDNNADNQNRRDRDNDNNNADRQPHRQAIQQLRQEAWSQFEESNQLFQAAAGDLRNEEGNQANRAGGDRTAWSRRLFNVANQYANTLRNLSGADKQPSSSTGDQNQANNRNDNENRNSQQGRSNLSRTEIAQITLINHAVGEALGAYKHSQAQAHHRSAVQTAASQQLQAIGRQKWAESQRDLQNVIASANWQNNPENPDNNAQQGQASVQSLAQQARQVIDTLQRISTGEQQPPRQNAAPAGAVVPPGGVR